MDRKLPPLKSLVAFESVVRHGSVTKAADELHVTHGAISKHLASLEEWIGRPLFAKNRKTMQPTDQALLLADAAERAWIMIADAVETFRSADAGVVLHVLAPSTFAMRWLIPRLWSFAAEHEGIAVQLRQTHSLEDWRDIPFDLAIRTESKLPHHLASMPILRERLGLAISPAAANARQIREPADLAKCNLLRAATRPGEFEAWLEAAGIDATHLKVTTFPHFYLALEAALAGAGALVCPLDTISELIFKVELKEPLPQIRIEGPTYSALYDPDSPLVDAAATFARWLVRVQDTTHPPIGTPRPDGAVPARQH